MDKGTAYFELQSFIEESALNVGNQKLIDAMRLTAVQGFGWPIGVVIDVDSYRPKHKDKAVEAIIKTDESFDTWTLNSSGDFYLLKTLFEQKRDPSAIYIDVRLSRLLEAFARIAALYRQLGAGDNARIKVQFKYGGLLNRTLKIANPRRMPIVLPRISQVDEFSRIHEAILGNFLKLEYLETTVITYGQELAQLFDGFDLTEENARAMLQEHPLYQGVNQALRQGRV